MENVELVECAGTRVSIKTRLPPPPPPRIERTSSPPRALRELLKVMENTTEYYNFLRDIRRVCNSFLFRVIMTGNDALVAPGKNKEKKSVGGDDE